MPAAASPASPAAVSHRHGAPAIAAITALMIAGLATAAMLLPALWNGFPFVFHDTGGYLAAFLDRELAFGRSALYGAFLAVGLPLGFWPSVLVQAGASVWVVLVTLRTHGVTRPAASLAILVLLAAGTSLPWVAGQLMPDVWAGLAPLAIYLLAFRAAGLKVAEKAALIALVAFAMASHMGTLALTAGLCAVLAGWHFAAARLRLEKPALKLPAFALAAGLVLAPASNHVIAGQFGLTPGGSNFLFARLLQTGIAAAYLDEQCPHPDLQVCPFRRLLPTTGDDWLWDAPSPLNQHLGGWRAFEEEAGRVVAGSLVAFPLAHVAAAIAGTAEQFVLLRTGEGFVSWAWNTHFEFERLAPQWLPAFKAARQQQHGFDIDATNIVHLPVAVLGILGLPLIVIAVRRGRLPIETATFASLVILTLLANAAICGALSNPHHRYQSRIVWLAPLAFALALARRLSRPG